MKQVSEMLLEQLYNPKEFHFDAELANKHIDFIEKFCKLPSGQLGQPFKLELFQKARLQALFGFVDDNDIRQYNECLIIEGRKNGKSSELAAIELDLLVNDGEGSPQIYNVATQLEQSKLAFNAAHKMVKQSPFLSKHIKKRVSDLYFGYNFGFIKPLASNSNSLDGLDAHGVVIDELAAIKDRDLYDLMKQSMGARRQPILFTITTNGFVRGGIFDAQYEYACALLDGKLSIPNKRFLPFIYELDSPLEWDREDCWIKANPGLGTIKSYDYLRQMVQKAKDDITFKPTVLVKDFNLKENSTSRWLRWEDLDNEEMTYCEDKNNFTYDDMAEGFKKMGFKYGIGGFDYAETLDLAAAKVICKKKGDNKIYVIQMYWTCEKTMEELETKNKELKNAYINWARRGLLRVCEGHKITKQAIFDWFEEIQNEMDIYIYQGGFDRWHVDESDERYLENQYGKGVWCKVAMGAKTLSYPMNELKKDMQVNLLVYNNHPIDKWCLSNIEVKTDINGNIQPVKPGYGDKNVALNNFKKIDGSLALIIAYVIYLSIKDEFENVI
jgi:phage terminase large subunit-like protein